MSKRLLSELFPNFVKKEHIQSQRLSQGPFGAGLKKGRKYLKPGEKAPEGANVQTGPQGGQYYEEMGGGGAQGYDIDYGDPERSAQVREELDQQGMGVPPAPEAGPEISEDRNVVGGIDYGPVKPEIKPEDVDYGPAATPDVSEATFDGQGNIQLPGSDPYSVSEMISEGTDSESLSHLIDAYQNESGGKQSVPPILSDGYSGPLNRDSFEDYATDQTQYNEAFLSNDDYEDAIGFFDWLGSKAGTDTGAVDEDGFPAGSSPTGEERRAKRDSAFIGGGAQGFNRESGQAPTPDKEYDGYVGARAVEAEKKANEFIEGVGDHLMDQGTGYDPAEISDAIDGYAASRAYFPGSETYDKLQEAGQRFMAERKDESADYYGEDYALMAKMMQKHNINNRRPDPVILSNKGGRQRK